MRQAVALNTLANQDWKTQLARGYSNIPNMAIVDVIEENFTIVLEFLFLWQFPISYKIYYDKK